MRRTTTEQRTTNAIAVHVLVVLSLQIFLLTVILEAFQADEEGLAWAAAAMSAVLFATAAALSRLLRRG